MGKVLLGRVVGLQGLIRPRFYVEIRRIRLDLQAEVVLTRQFE
jgi:hypothetical protein